MAFLEAYIETEVSECQNSTNGPNRPHFQGVTEVSLHSTPKTLQIIWPLGISVSPKSFSKSKIFPASFKVFDNEPALPTCCTKGCGKSQLRNKNYFSTKRGHSVFQLVAVCQHIQQHLFQTEELRHKGMPVQQQSPFQLLKPSDVLHQKEHWNVQLLLVHVKFTFHIVNWGWGAILRIWYMAFRIGSDLFAALMLLEKYILDRVAFVSF